MGFVGNYAPWGLSPQTDGMPVIPKKEHFFRSALKQGYKDSNLEMTESESVALPFGDSPLFFRFSLATSGII